MQVCQVGNIAILTSIKQADDIKNTTLLVAGGGSAMSTEVII